MSGQKARRGSSRYPKSLQLAAVEEYLSGNKYLCEILKQFNIGDHQTLHRWVSKYEQEVRECLADKCLSLPAMKQEEDKEETKLQALEAENRQLKELLSKSNLKIDALETLISLAERTYELPIRKNFDAKQSKYSGKSTGK